MIEWVLENKEWVFSGIGVFLLGLLLTILKKKKNNKSIKMKQESGDNSNKLQVGRDLEAV